MAQPFIPYADPKRAAQTITPQRYQYASIVPYANTPGGVNAAYNTQGYQSAAANQAYYNAKQASQTAAQQQAAAQAAANQARIDSLRSQVNTGMEGYRSGAQSQLNNFYDKYGQSARNSAQGIAQSQRGINESRVNTALNLRRSMGNIAEEMRNNLRSFGTTLAMNNASDSGAADVGARLYARAGGRQVNAARNDAALQNRGFDTQQADLDLQESNLLQDMATYRRSTVDQISNELYNNLRQLDAQAAAEGLNGAVNFGVRDQLINEAIARLNQVDQQLSGNLAASNPYGQNQIMAEAVRLDQLGAGANPFAVPQTQSSFGQAPSNTGYAPISQLPIYYRDEFGNPIV